MSSARYSKPRAPRRFCAEFGARVTGASSAPAALVMLAVILSVVSWAGCGAKSGLDQPPPCTEDTDCPAAAFCGRVPLCLEGRCGLGEVRNCADGLACTEDRCDEEARACVNDVRDGDRDGFGDGSCGGDDCDDGDARVNPSAAERCTGGVDEDCDGFTDCSDTDCTDAPECADCVREQCTNGADDDCDDRVDCADSDCRRAPACCLAAEEVCTDAVDEDCDGLVDCLDPDCEFAPTCCNPTAEVCNGLDDDCDGVPDDGTTCYFVDGRPLEAVITDECGPAWYAYDSPDAASANTRPDVRRPDDVVVVVHEGPAGCGAALAIIADATNDGEGGTLAATFAVDPPATRALLVSDDPRECRYDTATGTGACDWEWFPCCTDGVLLGPFDGDFCVRAELTRPSGVLGLVALDGYEGIRRLAFGVPFEVCGERRPALP